MNDSRLKTIIRAFLWILLPVFALSVGLKTAEIPAPVAADCVDFRIEDSRSGFKSVLAELHRDERSDVDVLVDIYYSAAVVHRYAEASLWCEANYIQQWLIDYRPYKSSGLEPFRNYHLIYTSLALNQIDKFWDFAQEEGDDSLWVISSAVFAWAEKGNTTAIQKVPLTNLPDLGQQLVSAALALSLAQGGNAEPLSDKFNELMQGVQTRSVDAEEHLVAITLARSMALVGHRENAERLLSAALHSVEEKLGNADWDGVYVNGLKTLSEMGNPEDALARFLPVMHYGYDVQEYLSDILIDYARSGNVAEAWALLALLDDPSSHAHTASFILREAKTEVPLSEATDLYLEYLNEQNLQVFHFRASLVGYMARIGNNEGVIELMNEMPYQGPSRAILFAELDIQSHRENSQ